VRTGTAKAVARLMSFAQITCTCQFCWYNRLLLTLLWHEMPGCCTLLYR